MILIVCTGNVCRSPYIEMRLSSALAATGIKVHSAGTGALVGSEMEPRVASRLSELGIDPSGFRARQLTSDIAKMADLVLCATREHRSFAVRMEPRLLRRTFTLADLADVCERLLESSYMELERDGGEAKNTVTRVVDAATRVRSEVRARTSEEAAIVDPFRRSDKVFDAMFTQIEELLPSVIAVLTAPVFATANGRQGV